LAQVKGVRMGNRKPHDHLPGYVGERKHTGPDGGHIVILDCVNGGQEVVNATGRWVVAHFPDGEPGGNVREVASRAKAYEIMKSPEGKGLLPSELLETTATATEDLDAGTPVTIDTEAGTATPTPGPTPAEAPEPQTTAVAIVRPEGGSLVSAADQAKFRDRAVRYLDALGSELEESQRYTFVDICQSFGLNPFLREIHASPHWNEKKGRYDMAIIIGYEVYLKRGIRTGKVKGWRVWTTGQGKNLKAHVQIRRVDWADPFYHEVDFGEYAQYRWDKRSSGWVLTSFWKNKPRTMLKKVAIAQGFRLCFPDSEEIHGLPYAEEEISAEGAYFESELPTMSQEETEQVAADKGMPPPAAPEPPTQPEPPAPEEAPPAAPPGEPAPSSRYDGDAQAAEPVETPPGALGSATSPDAMYKEIYEAWKGAGKLSDAWRFFVSKGWIKGDQSLDDLSANQIVRLYNNWKELSKILDGWVLNNPAEG
jgi:phage recombination protein Bet